MNDHTPPSLPTAPAFVIGITGNMDLVFDDEHSEAKLRDRLATILLFIRFGAGANDPREDHSSLGNLGEQFLDLLPNDPNIYHKTFQQWPGIGENTELILLTPLAPGPDTIAAEVLTELNNKYERFHGRLRCPLPFPDGIYQRSSTFRGDTALQKVFTDLIEDLPEDDVFPVYLRDDIETELGLSPDGIAALDVVFKKCIDPDNKERKQRHLRYQASGEYVATFSDLLIAIDDDQFKSGKLEGTAEIIEAKRRGSTPGLLPFAEAFTWSDNGPILHLFHRRQKTITHNVPIPDEGIRRSKPLRILHPYELGPTDEKTRKALSKIWEIKDQSPQLQKVFKDWHNNGEKLITRIAKNLGDFNDSPDLDETDRAKEADELMKMSGQPKLSEHGDGEAFLAQLDPLARMRRRSASLNAKSDTKVKKTLVLLFRLAFVAALCIHLFSHFHPFDHNEAYKHWQTEHSHTSDSGLGHHSKEHPKPHPLPEIIRIALGLAGVALGSIGLLLFRRHLISGVEERSHDYRSLAEGIRIQFYWSMAGLRRSVASNYMQRFRSELDWIRNSISSLAFPHERNQKRFLELSLSDQFALVKAAVQKWVGPSVPDPETAQSLKGKKDTQENYFRTESHRKHAALHRWHAGGSAIALTGLLHLPVLIILAACDHWMMEWWAHPCFSTGLFALGLIPFIIALGFTIKTRFGVAKKREARKFSNIFFDHLFPHFKESRLALYKSERKRLSWMNFLRMLPVSIGLLLILMAAIFSVSHLNVTLIPGPLDLGIVTMGACLLGGALFVAFAEKTLLSEHEKQYAASEKLFFSARMKLEGHLKEMEAALDANTEESAKAFQDILENVHTLFFALGKEALDENSEWLLLHRARPMEPVMAG